MHQFRNDYSELAHEKILKALTKYSTEQNVAYGLDYHSENAANLIKEKFGAKDGAVYFLAGGTVTNLVAISYFLRPYDAILCAETGHINVHETGAVEGSGHKIFTRKGKEGKLYPNDVIEALKFNCDEHMVKIKMVYISNSTEIGTIYNRKELQDLYKVCRENNLLLFIDGARLGSALTSKENNIDPKEMGSLCDVFYIGGTKNGFLLGEALVINNKEIANDFRHHIKNRGAMLAKGYLLGIEFEAMFEDDLYFKLAKETNEVADYLKTKLKECGLIINPSPTNQVFCEIDKGIGELIIENLGCEKWKDLGDKLSIRFVTSFRTKKEDVDEAVNFIKSVISK